jgi:hypothetical protein
MSRCYGVKPEFHFSRIAFQQTLILFVEARFLLQFVHAFSALKCILELTLSVIRKTQQSVIKAFVKWM